jgi:hypothetical protein
MWPKVPLVFTVSVWGYRDLFEPNHSTIVREYGDRYTDVLGKPAAAFQTSPRSPVIGIDIILIIRKFL